MKFNHIPVMSKQVIEFLNIKQDGVYVDGTIGGAGHSAQIIGRLSEKGILVGIDQDEAAIKFAQARLSHIAPRLILVNDNFKNIKHIVSENGITKVDGILLDLGVSSFQLDNPERGFSYQNDAPLDMRMNQNSNLTAEMIVNEYDRKSIEHIIKKFGEERWAARIATFIESYRKTERIKTTFQLVDIIKAAIPASARRTGPHPAKRTFQALRIAVNSELEILEHALCDCIDILEKGGRLCVIAFHSLEDTAVKNTFTKYAHRCSCPPDFPVCVCGCSPIVRIITGKAIQPCTQEIASNARARSAKFRVVEKI